MLDEFAKSFMRISNYKDLKEIIGSNIPVDLKIHIVESDISELVYRFWCRITGGKFERRQEDRQNSCVLVTKRGFHLVSAFFALFYSGTISGSELEVYKRNCPGPKPATYSVTYWHWWDKYILPDETLSERKCRKCGKPCQIQEEDKKIVGKF